MANNVFANNMEVSCKAANGKTICAFPDVCFTPPQTPATPPGVPIPYPNTGMASDCTDGSKSVKISNQEVMLKDKSYFKKSTGDEAGSAPKKGLINSKQGGKVYFIAWSMDVKVEGENVVRHMDMTTGNHASPQANAAVPTVHVDEAISSMGDKCETEKKKIKDNCNDEPETLCPKILGVPIKQGSNSAQKQIKNAFSGLSKAELKKKKVLSRLARASTNVAEKHDAAKCVRAMRCLLKPYGAEKNGSTGCCPGQTPHHIPPWSTFKKVKGHNVSHSNALCICLEGAGHSIGSHGKHHHGINFLLEQASGGAIKKSTNKAGHTLYSGPLSEHVKVSAAVTEAQCGCSKECIEQQLNNQFGDALKNDATHNASTTGGTSHGMLNDTDKAKGIAALKPAPAVG